MQTTKDSKPRHANKNNKNKIIEKTMTTIPIRMIARTARIARMTRIEIILMIIIIVVRVRVRVRVK